MAGVTEADFLLAQRGATQELGAWVVAAIFDRAGVLGFALADGTVQIGDKAVTAHDGAILSACADARGGFLTGSDDGRLVHTAPDGTVTQIQKFGSKWVDHVAAHDSGVRAASVGKVAHVLDAAGAVTKSLTHPSSVGGLAFDAKGKRLAASHYGGASLWFVAAKEDKPRLLEWKGSHHAIAFSPDGTHVVTAMQETALHGWRLADGQHMRMSGYPGKTHSIAFSSRGRWLATSGAESVVLWPFFGGGPMGKAPTELAGGDEVLCSAVAFHPQHEVVAAGFGDGLVLMAEVASGKVVPACPPRGSAITSLAWNATGTRLAFGTEAGFAGFVDLSKR
ncbi:WD40 repeat domain-containing protein [Falsiroseomonas tokyonensis]|uniref:WD40 repeat domain-containing protein n=1 Tax=Falsiroseomonas tokyonensis TaxID=430521 RepID=A0ABV7BMX9_9PROT|nr:WD40 repeat domain-containing protein [Falsiroseomonas tokyonensis]MBU8536895.1 PD40 domain-containing protein [Falsiroseomonas tokyonensis]